VSISGTQSAAEVAIIAVAMIRVLKTERDAVRIVRLGLVELVNASSLVRFPYAVRDTLTAACRMLTHGLAA